MQQWRMAKAQRFMAAAEAALALEDWETAVSRSYYAVYHLVVALLIANGVVRTRWQHDTVINDFRQRFSGKGFLFSGRDGGTLGALLEGRLRADYTEQRWTSRTAGRHLAAARELYHRLLGHLEV